MGMIDGIIGITLGVVLMTNLYLDIVHDTCTSGWSASEVALWGVVGLVGIIGIVYGTLRVFGVGGG